MKLAHLADLHLGFRQYERTTHGQNQRELDVARAWAQAVDSILAERPDLVLIAGDVFHAVRPTNHAIIALYTGLGRIRAALPETVIVVIAGNHDSPRTTETAAILNLYRTLGVHVVVDQVERIAVPGAIVTAVPHRAVAEAWAPDPAAPCNILLLHAGVAGETPKDDGVTPDRFAGWDYVALGDYHVAHQVAPNAWYPGSTEYTSSNPWGELVEERAHGWAAKGYLIVEHTREGPGAAANRVGATAGFTVRRVELPVVRRYVDLAGFDASGMAAAELDLRIAQMVDEAEIEGAVVRLVVTGVTRELRTAIDHAAIREYKSRALCFHLDLRRADSMASTAVRIGESRKLNEIVAAYLGERPLPPDVDRNQFIREGLGAFEFDPYTGERVSPEVAALDRAVA